MVGNELLQPVSVVICARNEADQLRRSLPQILAQRYMNDAGNPQFEVVVVNDDSADDTGGVLATLARRYAHLHVVTLDADARQMPGKKSALRAGVAAAAHPWLLFTDADCTPATLHWISRMVAPLAVGREIVAGYAPYEPDRGLLQAFVRWETLHTMLQLSGLARAGMPYMAVGRNFACLREVWQRAVQAPLWSVVPSGDDDLLLRLAATKENTDVVIHPEAWMYSPAKQTWRDWLRQKQRHMSTGKYYKPLIQALLGGYALSHAGVWLLFFLLLSTGNALIAIGAMAVRCTMYWLLWYAASRRLGERGLTVFFPLFDFGWMIYNFVLSPYILWKSKRQWT